MERKLYDKLLDDNITAAYRKCDNSYLTEVDKEVAAITSHLGLQKNVYTYSELRSNITLTLF